MREHAANWLEVAERVFHFRRDLLTDGERQLLQGATKCRRGRAEQSEAPAAEYAPVEAVGLRALALAQHQHAKAASRQQRCGGERPE